MENVPVGGAGGSGSIHPIVTGVSSAIASSSSSSIGVTSAGIVQQAHQEESSPTIALATLSESQRLTGVLSTTPSPVLSPPGKIFGRNANGTMVATSSPSNEAELQLYRVLQRASLLAYYDTLLEMGGDDVQQLCDAGEEEFLEIMALVGMATKPLHVRRLQKVLHEWATNPSAFQTPLPSVGSFERSQFMYSPEPQTPRTKGLTSPTFTPTPLISTAHAHTSSLPSTSAAGVSSHVTSSSLQLTPTLTDTQISRLALAAEKVAREIPQRQPRPQTSKKRTSREVEQVMAMTESNPRRMEEIRKYAAIYGRFDCKRRPEKPLTLHEVCVNEAAAQICKYVPAMLTRRDELFPLARQLVKDVGFGHSTGLARLSSMHLSQKTDEMESNTKRTKVQSESESTEYGKDLLEETKTNLFSMYQKFSRPYNFSDSAKFSFSRSDNEDNDSRYSFSNSSSPLLQPLNGSENDIREDCNNDNEQRSQSEAESTSPFGVQIISSSGGHIIAVANPALALSPALNETLTIKRETMSPDQ